MPWHVLCHSVVSRCSVPVSVTALKLSQLPVQRNEGSTEFSISRFLVPWLCGFEGTALFMDCDMLVQCDLKDVFEMKDETDVQVVKHDYVPREKSKFYGNRQMAYPRKNWSSVMLFDCARCTVLTPEYVQTASAMELHQFLWTDLVGHLPRTLNHLVGEDNQGDPYIIHWTNGGPWLRKYKDTQFAQQWGRAYMDMNYYRDDP